MAPPAPAVTSALVTAIAEVVVRREGELRGARVGKRPVEKLRIVRESGRNDHGLRRLRE
jgi:hypothetical protein